MIDIVDYGAGNIGSVINMFKRIGVQAQAVNTPEQLKSAQKILLPGVGAFDPAMTRLEQSGIKDVLIENAHKGVPILGICLGMHLLTRGSEEGKLPGLDLIPADVKKFSSADNIKVPHMGWNEVKPVSDHPLTRGLSEPLRYYFVHSYYVQADKLDNIVSKTTYGREFDSIIQNQNVFGAQFHPEKSHKFGQQFLKNFAEL